MKITKTHWSLISVAGKTSGKMGIEYPAKGDRKSVYNRDKDISRNKSKSDSEGPPLTPVRKDEQVFPR